MTKDHPSLHIATRPDGTRISVHTYPTVGSRPPILLVHGLGSDAETNWLRAGWVRALRKAGRTLISLDLRGHGHSDSPHDPDRYRLGVMVGDLRAALDQALGHEGPIDAIGYSLGARLLLEFAQHDLYEIRRLVVGGTAGQPLLQSIVPDDIERAVRGGALPVAAESARVTSVITALPSSDPLALVALLRGLNADPDTARRAPDPSMATLVGVGSSDPLHDGAAAWAGELAGAEFVSLPGRTHFSAVPSSVFRAAAVEFLHR